MALPAMQAAADATRQVQQTFYDGSSRAASVSERENPYPEGRLIISRTDLNGIITHVNEAFVEISGYTEAELIGQPHYILRHPDMPKAAFKDLWDTVSTGTKWHGYVKNLRKNGGFYWVYATVVPNIRDGEIQGYTSVRRKPSRSKVTELGALYEQMLAAERSAS